MKKSNRSATALCLLALAFLFQPASFAADATQQAASAPLSPSDQASASNDKLVGRLRVIAEANPNTKMYGQSVASAIIATGTSGPFTEIERALMQMKMALSSNQEAVGIIEQLLSRYQIAEAAAKAKRQEVLSSLTKELTDKFNSHAPLKDYDDLLKRVTDLEASSMDPYGRGGQLDTQRMENVRNFVAEWQDYLAASQAGNSQRASAAISQLVQLSTQFTAIPRSTLIGIQNAPVVEKSDDQDHAKADFDKLSAKAVAEIDAAKVPADLDAALTELGAYRPTPNQYGQDPFVMRVMNLKTFVQKWQEYLAARQSGRSDQVMAALRDLTYANYDTSFYPRSKILALQQEPIRVGKNMAKDGILPDPSSLTLDNIKAFSVELNSFNNQGGNQGYLAEHHESHLPYAVSRLDSLITSVKAGDNRGGILGTQNLTSNIGETGDYFDVLLKLYEELAFISLRSEIGVPDDLKPGPQEHISAFLERVITAAVARKDWRLAYRTAEVRRNLGQTAGNAGDEAQDYNGFESLIQAFNLDDAGQWTDAVVAYKSALTSTGPHMPTKEIGARLARIRNEHPDDYQKGETLPDYPALFSRVLEMREAGANQPRIQYPRPPTAGPGPMNVAPTTGFPQSKIQIVTPTVSGK